MKWKISNPIKNSRKKVNCSHTHWWRFALRFRGSSQLLLLPWLQLSFRDFLPEIWLGIFGTMGFMLQRVI